MWLKKLIPMMMAGTWKDLSAPDAAFSWMPFTVQQSGGRFRARPDWTIESARPTGKTYYVSMSGNDANDGLTAGTALRRIYVAMQKADVDVVSIAAGTYGFNAGFAGQSFTRSVSLIPTGGRVICGGFTNTVETTPVTWSANSGSYQTSRTNAARVVDLAQLDANGDPTQLTLAASLAACQATAGTYYYASPLLDVHLADGRAPDANVLVLFSNTSTAGRYDASNGTIYCENIDFVGSSAQGFSIGVTTGTVTGLLNACTFRFATNNGLASTASATTILRDCVAAKNGDDGFNYHQGSGSVPRAVEIDCIGRANGAAGDIDNGSTMHDGGSVVRLMGEYFGNVGRNVHDITSGTTSWNLGCYAHDSASAVNDVNWAAGSSGATGVLMWLDHCRSAGSAADIESYTGSTVRTRATVGTAANTGGGTIEAY